MGSPEAARTLYDEILEGQWDEHEGMIFEAFRARRKSRDRSKMFMLTVGDRVVFNEKVRPRYLEGVEGVIVGRANTKVIVDLADGPVGRFLGKSIRCPVSIIDKIEDEPVASRKAKT